MAVPAVLGRRQEVASEGAARSRQRARPSAQTRTYFLLVLVLTIAGLLSRIYTTNSLAGEPTPDEFLYGVHARDLARGWLSGQSVSLEDLGEEGRSVVVESAALSTVLPWDPITIGRTLQALLNALCIPMTYVLARRAGLSHAAAAIGAVLLMSVPEFQESAWRFWTDSQATFLSLIYLAALIAFIHRPALTSGLLSVVALVLLLLTKESAAVTLAPFLVVGIAIPIVQRLSNARRRYLAAGLLAVIVVAGGLAFAIVRLRTDLARNPLLERTFGAGPFILRSIHDAIPLIPSYAQQLVGLMGPVQLGTGFLWAALIGMTWLIAQSVVAIATHTPRYSAWVAGWVVATIAWLPAMAVAWQDVGSLHQTDPWILVAAGALLVGVGSVELYLRNWRRGGWGLALLGLVALAVLAERLIISVTPLISAAALTFRVLMPIVPLFAILGGAGLAAAAGAVALLAPRARWARPGLAAVAAAVLVVIWSPLVRERFSVHPLVGRVADRGADPDTPQGLRIQVLVDASGWLQANLRPGDVILAGLGIPRQLAWYADLGVQGMDDLIDVGSQPERNPSVNPHALELQRQYILDRVGPRGVDYVVDFNVDWMDPGGDRARQWRQTFDLLRNQANLELAYVVNDKYGYPVFYVLRNHGYVTAPKSS